MRIAWPVSLSLLCAAASTTWADAPPACRTVETTFTAAAPDLQIVVWVEDEQQKYVDTLFMTRKTAQFGLGNRPGTPLLKTDFGWPYGRREMVAPVWAHTHGQVKDYPKVLMGGECAGASVDGPTRMCGDGTMCAGDCVDSTIAYHSRVSSPEPFYCSPSGASKIDAMSCASKGTFSKGAFATDGSRSLYPPRADLTNFTVADSPDTQQYGSLDDLVAISGATPAAGALEDVSWMPPTDGNYVLMIEVSQESDWNDANNTTNHPNQNDTVSAWNFEGHPFLGQPSILYRVPFTVNGTSYTASTKSYAGYGAWDGQDGTRHSPDDTITTGVDGTGEGRLLLVNGARVTVTVGGCTCTKDSDCASDRCMNGICTMGCPTAPDAVAGYTVTPAATSVDLTWMSPSGGNLPDAWDIRYHEGAAAITDADFDRALSGTVSTKTPNADPTQPLKVTLNGLMPSTPYTFAVRPRRGCSNGPVSSISTATVAQQFTVLHGCFVATAAYGAHGDRSVVVLRRLRDRHLVDNAAGQLFVAAYYAVSPSLASAIASDTRLRAVARDLLAPLVRLAHALP